MLNVVRQLLQPKIERIFYMVSTWVFVIKAVITIVDYYYTDVYFLLRVIIFHIPTYVKHAIRIQNITIYIL